jgi:hypothetical protein
VKNAVSIMTLLAALYLGSPVSHSASAQAIALAGFEYIDIRWDGTDRMCVVYPDGRVDFIGKELEKVLRPDDANKRAFHMTLAVNRVAAQGLSRSA